MIYDVRNLSFAYHPPRMVIRDISFTLGAGQILTILGANGAGKSTLLDCLGNLQKPSGGGIYLCGNPLEKMGVKQVASTISYVQQTHVPVFAYTVAEFVTMGLAPHMGVLHKPPQDYLQRVFEMLKALNIEHLAHKPYTDISGGERQIATIARALIQGPKAILFDEPTAHLDYGNQIKILRLIKRMSRQGIAVIITTHNPDHAILLGEMVAIMKDDGVLEIGVCEQIVTQERLKRVYDTDLAIVDIPALSRMACVAPNL